MPASAQPSEDPRLREWALGIAIESLMGEDNRHDLADRVLEIRADALREAAVLILDARPPTKRDAAIEALAERVLALIGKSPA